MRRILLILLPVILILVLLFLLRGRMAPDVVEIESDDALVRLVIPREALIVPGDAETIRIVRLDAANTAPAPGVLRPLFAYRFEPEGLFFRQPVQLIIDPAFWGPRQLPVLLHRTATHLTALELEVGVVNERVESIKAAIPHFSEVLGTLSVLSVQVDDPGDQHVQAPFYVRSTVAARPAELDRLDGDPNGVWSRQRVQGPVRLSGGAFNATGTLAPAAIAVKPASADMALTAGHSEFEAFECTAESTGNSISYTVQAAFKLLLNDSFNPNRIVEVPINDRLTVRGADFACLAPRPLPSVDRFDPGQEVFDAKGEEIFETEIVKTPGGRIAVGSDFTLKATVTHVYDGANTTALDAWDLRYGKFEYAWITNDAISPPRVGDLPWLAVVAPEDSWTGEARFRCMNAGSAAINYKAFVYAKAPNANTNGVLAVAVDAQAAVECVAGTEPPGTIGVIPGTDRLGPESGYVHDNDNANGFQVRWWREPARDRIYIGEQVKVHVEVESLRQSAAGLPGDWSLSGRLYTMAGTGLEPRRYPEAPPHAVPLPFRGVWSADYDFTCRNADIAALRHDFTLLPPAGVNEPSLQLSVNDPGLRCAGD